MTCSCDYDPPDFCRVDMVTARKPHRCDDCARGIAPGEQYQRVSGKWEGSVSTFCVCADCHLLRDLIDLYLKAEEERIDREVARRVAAGNGVPGRAWIIRQELSAGCDCAPALGDLKDWIGEWEREQAAPPFALVGAIPSGMSVAL